LTIWGKEKEVKGALESLSFRGTWALGTVKPAGLVFLATAEHRLILSVFKAIVNEWLCCKGLAATCKLGLQ
jgi:hypothetical protein